jgi:predicted outer membrane lipoprotein
MKDRHGLMPILRLAYTTQFLIALIAVFVLWSQVGGQSHLDLLPWSVKLGLGLAAAFGVVRATAASVSGDRAWNGQTVRWLGLTLAVLAACGYATYYAHMNLEEVDDTEQQDTTISRLHSGIRLRLVHPSDRLENDRVEKPSATHARATAGSGPPSTR